MDKSLNNSNIKLHYDKKVKKNINYVSRISPHFQAPYNFALKKIVSLSPSKVLDLGCGIGDLSVKISQKGIKVTGVDFSAESIKIANKNGNNLTNFIISDIYEFLSSNKDKYDVIFMSGVLYYLNIKKVMPLIIKNLAKNGIFICIETNGGNSVLNLYRKLFRKKARDYQTLNNLLNYKQVKGVVSQFSRGKIMAFDFFVFLTIPFSFNNFLYRSLITLLSFLDNFIFNILKVNRLLSFKYLFYGYKK